MGFWDDYLADLPPEVWPGRPSDWRTGPPVSEYFREPSDTHFLLRRGHEHVTHEELWDLGSGVSQRSFETQLPSLPDHGGRTLCGLDVNSGRDIYPLRWSVFMEGIGEGSQDPALLDLHGVSCMACRRRLMYGLMPHCK